MNYKFAPYSVSKIDCFTSCPKKFEFRYIIKPEVKQSFYHLEKGTLWHSIIEHVLKRKVKDFKKPNFNELVDKDYLQEFSKCLNFVKSQFFLPYLHDIMTFKQLIEQKFTIFENGTVDLEFRNNALFRGVIDLLQHEDNFLAHVIDWKTGGKDLNSLINFPKSSFQLDVYAYVVNKLLNPPKILGKYVFVEHEYEQIVENFNHMETWREIMYNIETIESTKEFIRNKSKLCNYCEYQSLCN